jgi:antitoxin (DNA-binding transcriptional repressor) of toxin-antitoxin stability system
VAAATTMEEKPEDEGVMVLRCFDGVKLAVPAPLARQRSGLVVEAAAAGERVVEVPGNVSGRVVARIVAYWEARAATTAGSVVDGEFLARLRHDDRVDLIRAAHHLRDTALFDLFRLGA